MLDMNRMILNKLSLKNLTKSNDMKYIEKYIFHLVHSAQNKPFSLAFIELFAPYFQPLYC